jgi:hypothetical protein
LVQAIIAEKYVNVDGVLLWRKGRLVLEEYYYAWVRVRGKLIWKSLKASFRRLEQVTLGAPWRIRAT